ALPLFIWLAGAALFVSFAFFAFAQAAVARGGAQSAADAAALAAGQEARSDLVEGLIRAIEGEESWSAWLLGEQLVGQSSEAAAEVLANENSAKLDGFESGVRARGMEFRVAVSTSYTVGESLIPGTESMHAEAEATALVSPLCTVPEGVDEGEGVEFVCDGEEFSFSVGDLNGGQFPDDSLLFSVHLVE
ncbi:hypothetical protein ACFRPV_38440, partial [Kitasatospora sp. NPDC056808]